MVDCLITPVVKQAPRSWSGLMRKEACCFIPGRASVCWTIGILADSWMPAAQGMAGRWTTAATPDCRLKIFQFSGGVCRCNPYEGTRCRPASDSILRRKAKPCQAPQAQEPSRVSFKIGQRCSQALPEQCLRQSWKATVMRSPCSQTRTTHASLR